VSLDLLTFINIYYLFTLLTLRKNSPAKQIESQIINAGSAGVKKSWAVDKTWIKTESDRVKYKKSFIPHGGSPEHH